MHEQPVQVIEPSENKYPNLVRFQKGVSGNPGGKPKGEDVRALARKNTKKAMQRIIDLIDDGDPRVAFMAAKEVLDRAYGKPKVVDDDTSSKTVTINIVKYTEPNGGSHDPEQLAAETVSVRTLELSGEGR